MGGLSAPLGSLPVKPGRQAGLQRGSSVDKGGSFVIGRASRHDCYHL